jgi:hypothetical protein
MVKLVFLDSKERKETKENAVYPESSVLREREVPKVRNVYSALYPQITSL